MALGKLLGVHEMRWGVEAGVSRKLGSLQPALTISLSKDLTHVSSTAAMIHSCEGRDSRQVSSKLVFNVTFNFNHSNLGYCKK